MYEAFGFSKWQSGQYGFQLFVPDNAIDPAQYTGGGSPNIASVAVFGDFQIAAGLSTQNWDPNTPLKMTLQPHPNGLLFTAALPAGFPDGYYQYKYLVTFQDGTLRKVGDPCTKYGGTDSDNSAFVVGGSPVSVTPLDPAKRLSGEDLILYELMISDFTSGLLNGRAPVDAVADKLTYIKNLGTNAIEFMPWIAWPDSDTFSWGYDPAYFFSAEYNYITDPTDPLEKLSRLGDMISACHQAGLMVVLDIVLQHAADGGDRDNAAGFPYRWLWQDPTQCPFIQSSSTPGGSPFQYANRCTLQFIGDVCQYWIDRFSVDGFRFDQVSGFDFPGNPSEGATALMSVLKSYLATQNNTVFPLMIEDTWDFDAVHDTNTIGATHGWFDLFRSSPMSYLPYGNQPTTDYLRVLNAAYEYNFPIGPVIYIENHDHTSVTFQAGGRDWWFRVQPYMIALATSAGAVLLANGQEFGRSQSFPEPGDDDANHPRVSPRPLDWSQSTDSVGQAVYAMYQFLLHLRQSHPGLRTPNFYPDNYDQQWNHFSPDGYGLDVDKQVVIYHRWGNNAAGQLERFMVVLNFSAWPQTVNIPFPANGIWTDLLNGNSVSMVENYWLYDCTVNSYWGCIFYLQG
jgi:pullulanase/glycogen debranching enzyme